MNTRPAQGFSLLEVILALAIMAGAMVILGELARQGLHYAEAARDVTQAQMLCESKLAEFTAGVSTPTASGAAPLDTDASSPQKWLYAVDVTPLSEQGLMSVRVTVTKDAPGAANPLAVSLTRWMIDPSATFGEQTTPDDYSNMQQAAAVNCNPRQPARRTALRRGFTLLEVLLALGLSVLLLAAIGLAIEFHLRLLDTGRAEVEQAQLARAILRRIADDLRGALQYTPSPSSSTSSAGSSNASPTSADSLSSTTDPSSTPESSDESMLDDQQMADRTTNLADATSLPALPGIYGNDHELQIDVSRLPRLDQMQAVLSSDTASGSMSDTSSVTSNGWSDLRTVLYYAGNAASATPALSSASSSGLLRRDMDRITASLAAQQGESLQTQGNEESMAPEVQDLQFRYFDGTEWVDTWDTTDRSGLPLAVQIGIWLPLPQNSRRGGLAASAAGETNEDRRMYQLLVHLPAARATTSASASGTDSTSSSSTNSSANSGSSSTTSSSTTGSSSSGGPR